MSQTQVPQPYSVPLSFALFSENEAEDNKETQRIIEEVAWK